MTKFNCEPYPLELRSSFGTAHSATTARTNVLVRLADGFGEIGLPPLKPRCYLADLTSCMAFADRYRAALANPDAPCQLPTVLTAALELADESLLRALGVLESMPVELPSDRAARSGFQAAILDAIARQRRLPLWRLLFGPECELGATRKPLFYTVALNDNDDELLATARFGAAITCFIKVKVDGDLAKAQRMLLRIDAAARHERRRDDVRLVVDANCSWTPATALAFLAWLPTTPLVVTALEQPFAVDVAAVADEWRDVRRAALAAGLDLVADESCSTAADVHALAPLCTAVNIKLEKCGGVAAAIELAAAAKAASLKVWLGTMVGSTLNSNTVAQLLPLSDLGGDLDGTLLVQPRTDRFSGGFAFGADGCAVLSDAAPGIGVELKPPTPAAS